MKRIHACGSDEHQIARRQFWGALPVVRWVAWGMLAASPAAKQLEKTQQRVVCIYMSGGLSQLESWDPKPKTNTGGPFRAIPTSVPGIHISELLSRTAKHMDKLALVRGINTRNGDHGKGNYHMQTVGRRCRVCRCRSWGRLCEGPENPRTDARHIRIGGGARNDSAYLGPLRQIGANGKPPPTRSVPRISARRPTSCGTVSVARPTTGSPCVVAPKRRRLHLQLRAGVAVDGTPRCLRVRRSRRRCTSSTGKSRLGRGA
ncbi:MAG: hypothetical protein Ct9H300mP1_26160 [Planctomycetaceae bacterium]|nr:MAG: hypothetical protein Ct9H300mP1_26160 [Planctomycetaceae bacterium]